MFFVKRPIVATTDITFIIGIQHVSEWFEEKDLGMAEGIYAGVGNAGAASNALILPHVLGADWSGPLFQSNRRAAFFYAGVISILLAIVYYVLGEATSSKKCRQAAADNTTLKQWAHTATRYGTVTLTLAYVTSLGLRLSMNGWLATYYHEAFNADDLVLASMFAATFSIAAGLFRSIGSHVSDVLARKEMDILPVFEGCYREQSTFMMLSFIIVSMLVVTLVGLSGAVLAAVAAGSIVGMACAFAENAIFAQVSAMFPNSSGAITGVVDDVGTIGGITYPLAYSLVLLLNLHVGYALITTTTVPIVLLNAWVHRLHIAKRAAVDSFFGSSGSTGPTDDRTADRDYDV